MATEKIKRSRAQEARVANLRDAHLHSGSGSGPYKKNDMHNSDALIECKRTDNATYIRLVREEIEELQSRAEVQGRRAEFWVEIDGIDYVVLPAAHYLEVVS